MNVNEMKFIDVLREWPSARVQGLIRSATASDVETALAASADKGCYDPEHLAALLSPAAEPMLESMAQLSAHWTRQRFGRAIDFFAPLYCSNICCNGCRYCGFNTSIQGTVRCALTVDQAETEALCLAQKGFGHILLVGGEDWKNTPPAYYAELTRRIRSRFASVNIEIYAVSLDEYRMLHEAGVDGMTMFQETYNPEVYKRYHPYGPKSNFENRIDAFERASRAGMEFIGLGALLGINDWREEGFYLGLHADYLQRRYWRDSVAISFPRMRHAKGGTPPEFPVSDANLVQLMCALRCEFPDVTMTLSTRELPGFREELVKLAVTKISAESKTNPGGYSHENDDTPQFEIADARTLPEVAAALRTLDFDPVMKNWDASLVS
ncbi:MAG: 2-iminoacetate synthase ThiH [Kiritimatiellae bacterium]|nr:2-iminoacetate synthase ThiH [Kiritimatiellia bacterium]